MSRPRRPFGVNPPGRLPATMVKVLAAELSDQGRLARGKRYHADDAVIDLVVGHGVVTGEVQGSRREPYVVTITARPGEGVPGKRDVRMRCTCPDDTGVVWEACKHAVAVLFALSDEIAIEPAVLDRWRGGAAFDADDRDGADSDVDDADDADAHADGHELASRRADRDRTGGARDAHESTGLAPVVPIRSRREGTGERDRSEHRDPSVDEIAGLLAAPAGAAPPSFSEVDPIEHPLADPLVAGVLNDALDHLEIDWG